MSEQENGKIDSCVSKASGRFSWLEISNIADSLESAIDAERNLRFPLITEAGPDFFIGKMNHFLDSGLEKGLIERDKVVTIKGDIQNIGGLVQEENYDEAEEQVHMLQKTLIGNSFRTFLRCITEAGR